MPLEPATRIASELDHPAYDCITLALAAERDCRFVTAGKNCANSIRAGADSPRTRDRVD